jgi:hypothetical protein
VLAHPSLGAEAPRPDGVRLVLRRGARVVVLGWADRGERCGLGFVDDLLHLQLALRRVGWDLHLDVVPSDVAELLELVGLPQLRPPGPRPEGDQASRCDGRPSSSKRSR